MLEPVHPDMGECTFAKAAESLASYQAFLTAKNDCFSPPVSPPWSILMGNIINTAAPLREKLVWIHHTGQCLRARHFYHWQQTSPSSLIFPWKESLWDLPVSTLACPPKGHFLTSLAIFIYTQQMDLSHTARTRVWQSWLVGREKFLSS